MLDGRCEQAERIYVAALAAARDLPPESWIWGKTLANVRFLYFNAFRPEPHTPDAVLARTLPLWVPVLGAEHHFILRWVRSIEGWRAAST